MARPTADLTLLWARWLLVRRMCSGALVALVTQQSRPVRGHVPGPALGDAGGVEGVRVVAGAGDRVTDVDQPPGGVGEHLHVEPALVVLVGEHVRLGAGAFPGRGEHV